MIEQLNIIEAQVFALGNHVKTFEWNYDLKIEERIKKLSETIEQLSVTLLQIEKLYYNESLAFILEGAKQFLAEAKVRVGRETTYIEANVAFKNGFSDICNFIKYSKIEQEDEITYNRETTQLKLAIGVLSD